jgi:hypothetical protein
MVMIPDAPRLGDLPEGGKPVPEGIYHVRCDKATYKIAKSGDHNPMVEAQFTIFGPEDAEQYHGRKVFDNLMLAGEGRFRIRQFLEATGEDEDFVLDDTDQLIGRECAVVVQEEKAREETVLVDGKPTVKKYGARNKIGRYQTIE